MEIYKNILESVNCNLCESEDKEIICKKGKGFPFVINTFCNKCSLIYLSLRWNQEYMKSYYKEKYSLDFVRDNDKEFFEKQEIKAKKRFEFLMKNLSFIENERALEVGSTCGNFLNKLSKLGFKVEGVQPSFRDIFLIKQNFNFKIYEGFFEDFKFEEKSYFLICFFHVLEHIYNPTAFLKELNRILIDDGFLYFEIPSILRNPGIKPKEDFFRIVHLYSFTPFSIKLILSKFGFEILNMDKNYNNIRALAKKNKAIKFSLPDKKEVLFIRKRIKRHLIFWNLIAFCNRNFVNVKKIIGKIL